MIRIFAFMNVYIWQYLAIKKEVMGVGKVSFKAMMSSQSLADLAVTQKVSDVDYQPIDVKEIEKSK